MIGRTLGHFRIDAKLGEGGMGVVYKAWDSHLNRPVAVKVLPSQAMNDPERKRRFVQEARAASALNHPNIIHIYDIASEDGVDYIAMEYVDGPTLEQKIARQGLAVVEVVRYGVQIADALARAHRAGIVHRDLKPGNIMITGPASGSPGLVKVLDFGLAKLTEPTAAAAETDATATLAARSEEGAIVGTVAYMSPEQASGQSVDSRSDVFSFGAVLYEMVTGRRAFAGATKLSTLSAVLHKDPQPPAEIVGAALPRALERIIARALRKDPERRWQHLGDLKLALEEMGEEPAADTPARGSRHRVVVYAALAVAAILAAIAMWLPRSPAARTQPNFRFVQITDQPGAEMFPSLAPDGRSLVYASQAAGNWDIWFQRVGSRNPINLTKDSPADDTQPAFSPDGERIAFRSDRDGGGIFVMGATGENTRRVSGFGYYPAWTPDGKRIFASTVMFYRPDLRYAYESQVYAFDVEASGSGRGKLITQGIHDAMQPSVSPHGHRIAYWHMAGGRRDVLTIPAVGGKPVAVTDDGHFDWNPAWSPDGKSLLFASDRGGSMNLWRVPIDEKSGVTQGPPEPVTTPSLFSAGASLSRDGRMIAYGQLHRNSNLYKVSLDPVTLSAGPPVAVTKGSREMSTPTISPDGRWLAFASGGKREEIFLMRTEDGLVRQLTDDEHKDFVPAWSPDGRRISFFSNRSGKYEIWEIHPDGSGLRQITNTREPAVLQVWSPDGARVAWTVPHHPPSVQEVNPSGRRPAPQSLSQLAQPDKWFSTGSWEKGGIAGYFVRADGSFAGIAVFVPDTGELRQLTASGSHPAWLHDGRRILFLDQGAILAVDAQTRQVRRVLDLGSAEPIFRHSVGPGDRTLYYTLSVVESDIWLAMPE